MGVPSNLLSQLQHLLRPLSIRIANVVARGVVQLVNDGTKMQLMQLGALAGEPVEGGNPGGAEHFHPYGFSSVPLTGAECVVVFPNGDRSHPLVVATSDRRYRPVSGNPGEVTVYNNVGAKVVLTQDGDIVATPAAGRKVLLGDGSASQPPALNIDLAAIFAAFAAASPSGIETGLIAIKAALAGAYPSGPVGATKVSVE